MKGIGCWMSVLALCFGAQAMAAPTSKPSKPTSRPKAKVDAPPKRRPVERPSPKRVKTSVLANKGKLQLWRFGGPGVDRLWSMQANEGGEVLLTGSYEGRWTNGKMFGAAAGKSDLWVMLLGADGKVRWFQRYGGKGVEQGNEVAWGPDGDFFLAGAMLSTDFSVGGVRLKAKRHYRCFVMRMSSRTKAVRWVHLFKGSKAQICRSLHWAPKQGKLWVSGFFSGKLSLAKKSFASSGNTDMFVARLDGTSGKVEGGWHLGGGGFDIAGDVRTLPKGGFVMSGQFSGGTFARKGRILERCGSLISNGQMDAFVGFWDAKGKCQQLKGWGSMGYDSARRLLVVGSSRLYVVGATAVNRKKAKFLLPWQGSRRAYVARLDGKGQHKWVSRPGYMQSAEALALDRAGYLWVFGHGISALVRRGKKWHVPSNRHAVWLQRYSQGGIRQRGYSLQSPRRVRGYALSLASRDAWAAGYFRDKLCAQKSCVHSQGSYDVYLVRWRVFDKP